ncbi:MAG TPA: undecaprenyl-diphosphate phosphatase [Aquimonas sp.]|nr:undecaprenyl-diphosphate phosphatase [Xanthomonadales bacterium]HRD73356.1 undecaprenyl-diphosphate phosphatase [Aquimonas sp.]HRF53410.1 undecaprenyl-diphosphate phosphatase [Aquimonas sp.]
MEFLHILILALVQALTEFLPVSSSGHLVLASLFLGWDYQGLAFDLALHFGTLMAVLIYFRADFLALSVELLRWRPGHAFNPMQRLALGLALSTVPAAIVGLAMGEAGANLLRHPLTIGVCLVFFGVLLGFADRRSHGTAAPLATADADFVDGANAVFSKMSLRQAVLIGCAQALALIPGTSRSGVTMTAGLFLGLTRAAAARYSFLMSAPVMVLASAHGLMELLLSEERVIWKDFGLGALISALAGVIVIHGFLKIIRRVGVMPFVIYRVALGVSVLSWYFLTQ